MVGDGENLLKQATAVGAAATADSIRRALRAWLLDVSLSDAHRRALALGRGWLEWTLRRKNADTPIAYARASFAPSSLRASSPPAAILMSRDDLERMVRCLQALEAGVTAEKVEVEHALDLFKTINRSALAEFDALSSTLDATR